MSLFLLHRAGGTRFCGLANVRRDPLWLVLLELGLLLPFVHLGHRDNTGGDGGRRAGGHGLLKGNRKRGWKSVIVGAPICSWPSYGIGIGRMPTKRPGFS